VTVTNSCEFVTLLPKKRAIVTKSPKNVTPPPQKQQQLGQICVEEGMRNRREEENWTYNGRYIK
jgi:hypothetical protein